MIFKNFYNVTAGNNMGGGWEGGEGRLWVGYIWEQKMEGKYERSCQIQFEAN